MPKILMKTIKHVGVIGAGTMGRGIVEVMARQEIDVYLYDQDRSAVERAFVHIQNQLDKQVYRTKISEQQKMKMLASIHPVDQLHAFHTCDLIIEAIMEEMSVKQQLFKALEKVVSTSCILATNTSSLSVTEIASVMQNPKRMLALHFFNPAPKMPLVEVVVGVHTDQNVAEEMKTWLKQTLLKEPVMVRDAPGFIVNRVARPFHTEAYRMVASGETSKTQVDNILQDAGFKMGPFQLQDLIGIDINYAASMSVYESFNHEPRLRPHPNQQKMLQSGLLGRKTKKGHYHYE
ncbi:3-hydroxyacyl-CoA dehydrogenase NAD-binding domain-containing protein [Polycladospora coralii]|nr:3-hydroxyacyl-CoA dehydrogenase NAD-binding domain-containing protein [Polycladospora coralii]